MLLLLCVECMICSQGEFTNWETCVAQKNKTWLDCKEKKKRMSDPSDADDTKSQSVSEKSK